MGNKSINYKERITWIDNAKFFAICLVVWGHSSIPEELKVWLYSFHMPLFFFLSGTTFNEIKWKNNFKKFLVSRINGMIIPYLLLSVVAVLWAGAKLVLFDSGSIKLLLHKIIGIFIQLRGTQFSVGLWFMPCIFLTELFFYILVYKLRKKGLLIFGFISAVLGLVYSQYIAVSLPWAIDAVSVALFFMIIGYSGKNIWKCKNRKILLIGVGILCILSIFVSLRHGTRVDMWAGNYGNSVLFILGAFIGIGMIVCLSQLFEWNIAQYIGKRTLFIYGIHIILIELFSHILKKVGLNFDNIGLYIMPFVICGALLIEPIYSKVLKAIIVRKQ